MAPAATQLWLRFEVIVLSRLSFRAFNAANLAGKSLGKCYCTNSLKPNISLSRATGRFSVSLKILNIHIWIFIVYGLWFVATPTFAPANRKVYIWPSLKVANCECWMFDDFLRVRYNLVLKMSAENTGTLKHTYAHTHMHTHTQRFWYTLTC